MPRAQVNGVNVYYEETGAPSGKPIVLISGLGTQLTRWAEPFVQRLAQRGYRVVRMDNRDAGLSESFDAAGAPDLKAVASARSAGTQPALPYTLDDMADDVAALLTHLGIERAHVVGSSMGGMIAQLLAIRHPDRVLTLTSIMSTTGNPELPRATPQAQEA
ncbi:alpha/beta fold hydrolase [Verticiella alkaliphila]|uniref:alpha/beta fold hydrolase n=1 Tax=Verticiella alkaliphila TaxID=2779529 RepID=UPI00209A73C4|nr:alpha/beta hydrolase [Verticiella sp. GG226]